MTTRLFGVALLLVAASVACSKSEAATPAAPSSSAAAPAAPKFEAEAYEVKLEAAGDYAKGKEGVVKVVLTARKGYHVNDKYPTKFTTQSPAADGMSYPKPVVKKDDGKFEQLKAELPIPVIPTKAGQLNVAGVFAFGVCNESRCLNEKLPLELTISVK
jgi:hypothetical protein